MADRGTVQLKTLHKAYRNILSAGFFHASDRDSYKKHAGKTVKLEGECPADYKWLNARTQDGSFFLVKRYEIKER